MGTRSLIGMEVKKDDVVGVELIYCHWDGYLSNNGSILLKHYADAEKIKELVSLGDLSSLGEVIGSKHDFNNSPIGECNFYNRDRGESGVDSSFVPYETLEAYFKDSWCEYMYIFKNDAWYVTDYENYNDTLLTKKLCDSE